MLAAWPHLRCCPSAFLYLLTSGVFGFLWMFSLPFFVPMVIAADPTRRAALLVGGAELTGGSLGPLLASFVVTDAMCAARSASARSRSQ